MRRPGMTIDVNEDRLPECYDQGFAAYGQGLNKNPYRAATAEAMAWFNGWLDGQTDEGQGFTSKGFTKK